MAYSSTRMGGLIVGLILVVVGGLLLLDQLLNVPVLHYTWPLVIVAIGALFFVGMLTREKEAGALAIPGAMIVMLGLIFLYQVITGHWSSWAYIWTLVAPTGTGIGLYIYGWWSDRPALRQAGRIVTLVGFILFLVFGAFVELVTSLLGFVTPGRFLWPVGLIVFGVLLLLGKRLLRLVPVPSAPQWDASTQAGETAPSELSTEVKDVKSIQSSDR